MDRNSFSILKQILIALLVLQSVVGFVYEFIRYSKVPEEYALLVYAGLLFLYTMFYGMQVVAVTEEHFTMVAIFMGFKVTITVLWLIMVVTRIIAVAKSSSAFVFYGNIAFAVFVSLLEITVLGLMVTFYVNRHLVTAGNRSTGHFEAQPNNTRPIGKYTFGTAARPGTFQFYSQVPQMHKY